MPDLSQIREALYALNTNFDLLEDLVDQLKKDLSTLYERLYKEEQKI